MSDNNDGGFMNAFLLGAVMGFVVGVLAAPRSGKEMRDEVNERTRSLREQVEHLAERIRQQMHQEPDAADQAEGSRDQ